MRVGRSRTALGAVTALVVGSLLAGCSSDPAVAPDATPAASASIPAPSPVASVVPTTCAPPAGASPLSGRAGGAGRAVLVVKLDNTTAAQPHAGLTDADVVYVEEVEWGLTRLAAVFSSRLPAVVGPVRSARISDLDLFAQYGKVAFAFSGAQGRMYPLLNRSPLVTMPAERDFRGYYLDPARRSPVNEMGRPAQLLDRAGKSAVAKDIGYCFTDVAPTGGRAATTVTASYPDSQARFGWNGTTYDVFLNKRPARAAGGGTQHATTVVIQYVKQHNSGFGDKYGGKTPKEETIGTGTGWVLRDGRAYQITWTRPTAASPTRFTGADGAVVAFAPGQVWVALVNRDTRVTLS